MGRSSSSRPSSQARTVRVPSQSHSSAGLKTTRPSVSTAPTSGTASATDSNSSGSSWFNNYYFWMWHSSSNSNRTHAAAPTTVAAPSKCDSDRRAYQTCQLKNPEDPFSCAALLEALQYCQEREHEPKVKM